MAKTILIIDDEEGIRDAFQFALEELDYKVETAKNGEEGVRKAVTYAPDLVFLDLNMPGMDGVETMRHLKEHSADQRIYIVTGFYEQYMTRLEDAAADGLEFEVARKPLGREQIQMVARAMLEGPQLQATGEGN